VGYGGAVVTLTSPTRVFATSSLGRSERFESADLPYDQTASSSFEGYLHAGANSHLELTVADQEIGSTFEGHCEAEFRESGNLRERLVGEYMADFSLDIIVDDLTPFYFEVQTSGTATGARTGISIISYQLYTPNSDKLDITFGYNPNMPGGSVSGVFAPGETYRLMFWAWGSADAQWPIVSSTDRKSSGYAVLVMPEPSSVALLLAGSAFCLPYRSRR
jgi:hypothetical protein